MPPTKLDHCVIHVSDWERSNQFYTQVMGAELVARPVGFAYRFGDKQLNVHGPGVKPAEVARLPVQPGNSDLCFEWAGPIEGAIAHLKAHGIAVERGPMQRFGAKGPGTRVYFRDPDGSLMEFMSLRRCTMIEAPGTHNPNVLPPEYSGAAGRRRRAPPRRHEAARSGAAGDRRRVRQSVEAQGPHRGLYLSAHRRAGRRCAAGLGSDPGRARLHAAILLASAIISTNSSGWAWRNFSDCRRRIPRISRRRRAACICRSRSYRTRSLALTQALKLPTFTTSGMTLLKRMALVIDDGVITKVFYPVFPPDKNAEEVIAWLQASK